MLENTQKGWKASMANGEEVQGMQLSVRQAAALAKLALTEQEEETMGAELQTLLMFAQELSQVDTEGVPMTAHVLPLQNVLRDDVPAQPFDRELLLQNAPSRTEDGISVPQTFA